MLDNKAREFLKRSYKLEKWNENVEKCHKKMTY